MIVIFEKEYLMELYVSGKTKDKNHRFQPEIIKGYKKRIDYIKAVEKVEDFFKLPSLRFENLVGDKEGLSSIRVNDKYRIEFTVIEREEPLISICSIVELSNHYK